jgi:hypothetical protein
VYVKAGVALAGAALLLWFFLAEVVPALRRDARVRDALLAAIAVFSCALWWNLGRFHFFADHVVHYYEMYHYYLGAKYAPELGYTRLYECTVVAEDEYAHLGRQLARIQIRDLTTNVLTSTQETLAHPERCKEHFTPERWQAFERDSDFFYRASSWWFWTSGLKDNGYNGTPVWRLLGGFIANHTPLSDRSLVNLASIDALLLLAMLGFIAWGFGWRTMCVCAIFWGTNSPGRYYWTGGAFLRMDWLLATVASISLVKRQRPFAAGVAIGVATLLRIFPGFVAAALVLKIVVESLRARRLVITPAQRRFVLGGAAAVALLVPLATWYGGGPACWRGFVDNSRKHLSTPLTNNMGLRTVVAYSPATRVAVTRDGRLPDPFSPWKWHQLDNFHRRLPLYVALVFAYVVLLGLAVVRHDDWVALALGVGFILVATQLTCYYFIVFLALGVLWPYVRWSGAPLLWASAASAWNPWGLLPMDDDRYVAISVVYLVLVVMLTGWLARVSNGAPAPCPRTSGTDR